MSWREELSTRRGITISCSCSMGSSFHIMSIMGKGSLGLGSTRWLMRLARIGRVIVWGRSCIDSMRILSTREIILRCSPGPADYINNPKKERPSTQKNTITFSNRLDLSKPLNTTPGPAFYQIVRYPNQKKPYWSLITLNYKLLEPLSKTTISF